MTSIIAPGSLQIATGTPTPTNLTTVSQPLLTPVQSDQRFRHFPPETYNLTPQSNVVRFLRTLLGDAGTGQLRKRLVLSRLGQLLSSSHFYDLDAFYGSLFGIKRTPAEQLGFDPYISNVTQAQWRSAAQADASYKQRLYQFGRAIEFGPTPVGMQLVAEAILGVPCDVYESFRYADQQAMTFTQLQAYTFNQLQAFTFEQLDGVIGQVPNSLTRKQFIISPHRPITLGEKFDLYQVINRIKPANALVLIQAQGPNVYMAVPLRGAWSDSNYWEVDATITGADVGAQNAYGILPGQSASQTKPPFTSYQGEQWFYNDDIAGTLSYIDDNDNVISPSDAQRIVWSDNSYTDYLPTNAPLPWWQTILGRYAQDGVMSINGLSGRGSLTSPVQLSNLYFDGIGVGQLLTSLGQTNGPTSLQKSNSTLSFWATDPRDQQDTSKEILEFRFGSLHTVNAVAFDVAHFPQHISFQVMNTQTGLWEEIFFEDIYESIPSVLNTSQDYLLNKTHPQHYGNNHWYTINTQIPPVNVKRFRIVIQRGPGTPPIVKTHLAQPTSTGVNDVTNDVPYSLAVRKFRIGYSIQSQADLPVPNLPSITTLGQTTDILGNPINYALYQEDPGGPISPSAPSQWRSEPQPINSAVVNYYVDTRTAGGLPQVIDRFFVDPTHLGVHATLYWSNDTPSSGDTHTAQDTPLAYPLTNISGDVINEPTGLQFPVTAGSTGYVDVDNHGVQWDPTQDWWVGLRYQNTSPTTSTTLPVIDLGGIKVAYANGSFTVTPLNAPAIITVPVPLPLNAQVILLVSYSVTNGWGLMYQINAGPIQIATVNPSRLQIAGQSTDTSLTGTGTRATEGAGGTTSSGTSAITIMGETAQSSTMVAGSPSETESTTGTEGSTTTDTGGLSTTGPIVKATGGSSVSTSNSQVSALGPYTNIRIGGFNDGSVPAASGMLLNNLVLKAETLQPFEAVHFFGNTTAYCVKGLYRSQDLGLTINAHLRFDESFVSSTNPSGMVGGPPSFYPDLFWNPVPGDYILTRGYLMVPPTRAKFWKVEMTNLVAEPFEGFLPTQQRIQTFPSSVIVSSTSTSPSGWQGPLDVGIATLMALAQGENRFPTSGVVPTTPGTPAQTMSPTDVLISTDPSIAQQIGSSSWLYNFSNYHQGMQAPRFLQPGYHVYQTADVAYTAKVAYFTGFNIFKAFRSSVLAQDDTVCYTEAFLDDLNITVNTFEQNPGDLFTPNSVTDPTVLPMIAQSVVYTSTHDVVGVQFATNQSDPVQVVTDDDFRNPALMNSSFKSTDTWHAIGDVLPSQISYESSDNSLLIGREAQAPPAAETILGGLHGLVNPPVEPPLETENLFGASGSISALNYGGIASGLFTLSPAGRSYVAVRFTPLTPVSLPWYLQLIDNTTGRTIWEEQVNPIGSPGGVTEFYASYDMGSVPNMNPADPLRVTFIQKGKSNDIVSLDTLSVFDESIVWEFSVDGGITFSQSLDTRNNSNGVLSFRTPSQELVWRVTAYRQNLHIGALQIRPIYESQLNVDQQPFMRGPNLSTFDTTPDIYTDPMYNDWTNPIPRWWFIAFKQYPNLFPDGVPIVTQFSSLYNRSVADNLVPTLSDSAAGLVLHNPITIEFLGIRQPMGDAVHWISGSFTRTATASMAALGDAVTAYVITPDRYPAIIEPPVHKEVPGPSDWN